MLNQAKIGNGNDNNVARLSCATVVDVENILECIYTYDFYPTIEACSGARSTDELHMQFLTVLLLLSKIIDDNYGV